MEYRNPYQRYMEDIYKGQMGYSASDEPSGINWVQGIEGAKAVKLKPKQIELLMDSESDRLFIKSCDDIGKPSIRSFKLVEEDAEMVVRKDIPVPEVDLSDYVKRDEIQNIVLEVLGGMAHGKRESVQPINRPEQTTVQNAVNSTTQPQYYQL